MNCNNNKKPRPKSSLTSFLVKRSYEILGKSRSSPIVIARTEVTSDLLLLPANRIAESAGGGYGHGLLCSGVRVRPYEEPTAEWCPVGVEGEVLTFHAIDIELEDYKQHNHYGLVSVASPIESCDNSVGGYGLNLYRSLDRLVRVCGMEWKYVFMEGVRVRTIDYYVIRLDLNHTDVESPLGKVLLDAFEQAMGEMAEFGHHTNYAKYMKKWLGTRWVAKDVSARFLNVAGDTLENLDDIYTSFVVKVGEVIRYHKEMDINGINESVDEMTWELLLEDLPISVKSGPVLRGTCGNVITHMPISSGAAAKDAVNMWKKGEKDVNGNNTLNIVSHSGRHTATCRARVRIILTYAPAGMIDELIDGHMKWEAQEGKMRKHYTGHLELRLRLCVTLKM